MRFEFGGAAGGQELTVPTRLEDPVELTFDGANIRLAVPFAKWGGLPARWETSHDQNIRCLDLVLYPGEEREFDLAQMAEAAFGLTWSFASEQEKLPQLSCQVGQGRLEMNWADMALSIPIKPAKLSDLQKSHKVTTLSR